MADVYSELDGEFGTNAKLSSLWLNFDDKLELGNIEFDKDGLADIGFAKLMRLENDCIAVFLNGLGGPFSVILGSAS